MEFRKRVVITLYVRQQKRHRCIEHLLDSGGEGKGGMIWENSIETRILSYVKQIASPGSMHETGCSGLVHWDDPEGWDAGGGGMGVQDGEHVYTHGWFMSMYSKTTKLKKKKATERKKKNVLTSQSEQNCLLDLGIDGN